MLGRYHVQGDHSGCAKPPVDNDMKVALILKCNFLINVNGEVLHNLNGHPVV